jgi:hypothetical protein
MATLVSAVEQAMASGWPDVIKVRGHEFAIRSLGNRNRLQGDETGYFRHEHAGEDDRVFFSVKVNSPSSYEAKITRIEYRGLLNSGTKKYDLLVNGAASSPNVAVSVIAKIVLFLKGINIQSAFDGSWEIAAAEIVDTFGKEMAEAA